MANDTPDTDVTPTARRSSWAQPGPRTGEGQATAVDSEPREAADQQRDVTVDDEGAGELAGLRKGPTGGDERPDAREKAGVDEPGGTATPSMPGPAGAATGSPTDHPADHLGTAADGPAGGADVATAAEPRGDATEAGSPQVDASHHETAHLETRPPDPQPTEQTPAGAHHGLGDRPDPAPTDEPTTDPYGMRRYFAEPAVRQPTTQLPAPARRRPSWGIAALAAVALIAALLGGGVGGAVGYSLAGGSLNGGSQGGAVSPGVLEQPLPPPAEAEAPLGPVEAVAARVLPSVVQLRIEGARSSGEGSGIVLSRDGLLLTNNHVVEVAANGGKVTAVFQDGATAPVQIVGRDPSFDLAVLRAQNVSGLTPIELGNSDAVRVGQQVIAFGSPLGLGGTVTTGIISAINRPVSVGGNRGASEATVLNALQTDAAINPGNSGGPLVDMEGKLIGINSAIATTGAEGGSIGVGFSIPVNQVKRVAEELERTGKASRAQLGVGVGDDQDVSGARIRSVQPGSAAEKAGLKAGDVVLRFGGQRILSGEGLQAAVRSRAPGETVPVELSDRTLSITLDIAS